MDLEGAFFCPPQAGKKFGGVGPIINGGPIITLCYDVRCTEFLGTGSDFARRRREKFWGGRTYNKWRTYNNFMLRCTMYRIFAHRI